MSMIALEISLQWEWQEEESHDKSLPAEVKLAFSKKRDFSIWVTAIY